jgi:small subunit ribosomal protein S16
MGKIRQPYYRVVVVDARKKRDGRVIEEIGKYHPKDEPSFIEVVSDRAQYWLGVGAQPSDAVAALLKVTGDWQKFKGLPGAEGTLRTKEAKRDKQELFNEALKDAANEPKGDAVTKKKAAKKMAQSETPDKAADKSEDKPADKAAEAKPEEPAAEETPAEETPAAESPVTTEAAADADVVDAEKTDAAETDAAEADAEKTDAEKTDAEKTDAEKTDAEKTGA